MQKKKSVSRHQHTSAYTLPPPLTTTTKNCVDMETGIAVFQYHTLESIDTRPKWH